MTREDTAPNGDSTARIAGLAADSYGVPDDRPPLVLLHGLTFDRTMWRPALDVLRSIDPRRRVLAVDLPGHGDSPWRSSHTAMSVAEAVHDAVEEAELERPVVVGHSIAAIIATVYAARFDAAGVVNVDQPLETSGSAAFLRSIAERLRGPDFPAVWEIFRASMHPELLPPSVQELVGSSSRPRQDLVLSYWQEVLETPPAELAASMEAGLAILRDRAMPYLIVAGEEPDLDYRQWLGRALPGATVEVIPGSGHFPQLANPEAFARCLASTASWSGGLADA